MPALHGAWAAWLHVVLSGGWLRVVRVYLRMSAGVTMEQGRKRRGSALEMEGKVVS